MPTCCSAPRCWPPLAAGCTISRQAGPSLSGPSEFAIAFRLKASPEQLPQDGWSASVVRLTAIGASGSALSGESFRVTAVPFADDLRYRVTCVTSTPGTLSTDVVTTAADGSASVNYTAPPDARYCDSGRRITLVRVYGTPVGTNYGTTHSEFVSINLVPVVPPTPAPGTPIPAFTFSPASPTPASFVTFDASPSMAGAGHTLVSYAWDYDDGTKETGEQNTHDFLVAHTYHVKLTVTDEIGQVAFVVKDVTVQ